MKRHHRSFWILASCVALLAALKLSGHHKIEAAFWDASRAVTLQGVISGVEWQNPHVYVYVEVRDAAGKTQRWTLEGEAPAALMRAGWTKDTLKSGDKVTVHGFLARQRQISWAGAATLDLPDGRTLRLGPDLSGR